MFCVRSFWKEKPGHFDLNFPGEAVVNQRRLKCQLVVVKTPDPPKPHRRQTCDVDSRVEANEMKHDWLREASDNSFCCCCRLLSQLQQQQQDIGNNKAT